MPKLTKRAVDALQPGPREYRVWCSELPGFGVKVPPSGRLVFIARYRNRDRKDRLATIGRVTDWSVEQARDRARALFRQVAEGRDPVAEADAYAAAPTWRDLYQRYMADHARAKKKPRSVASDESIWQRHILPRWAERKVVATTREDVVALHAAMRDMPTQANRTVAVVSKAMNLAETWRWRPLNSNPCRHVARYRETRVEGMLGPDQLVALGRAMREALASGSNEAHIVPFFLLLLLTGCRDSELRTARWSWIDWHRGLLLLPDSKTGQRAVALSEQALVVLRWIHEGRHGGRMFYQGRAVPVDPRTADVFVFPSPRPGRPMSNPARARRRLLAAAGLPVTIRLHDLRHTFGSVGHQLGASLRELADALGHSHLSTTERYVHAPKMRTASQVSDHLASILGPVIQPPEQVVTHEGTKPAGRLH